MKQRTHRLVLLDGPLQHGTRPAVALQHFSIKSHTSKIYFDLLWLNQNNYGFKF